jgi:hypothetical protein
VKEEKADVQRLSQELYKANKSLRLVDDTLRVTFESEMVAMCEEHNWLVEAIKERDDTIQRDLIEVDHRLNRHRRELNELDTKVGGVILLGCLEANLSGLKACLLFVGR